MKRYALCIGNNNYKALNKLLAAKADAEVMAEKLKVLGFDVDTAYDLEGRKMAAIIGSLEKKIRDYDAILFYYAGHGFEIDGINMLAPIDLNPNDEKSLIFYDAFKISDLMELLKRGDSNGTFKTKVIILDACRSQLNIRGSSPSFAPILAPQGSIIAFSTSPGQTATECNGHGIYTATLLRCIDTPRTSIETVFKRVRTALANETNGAQISWEHTSLIGDFYLNPNTIYDGTIYSYEALADCEYVFDHKSILYKIVNDLKSHNYYVQQSAIREFRKIDSANIEKIAADELFVLGRNIYQAACGGCWDCQNYINCFAAKTSLPDEVKLHILNGMAFEIYYNSYGALRQNFKGEYSSQIIELLESENFYGSQRFIASRLSKEENIFYIPGQDEKVDVYIKVEVADERLVSRVSGEEESIFNALVVKDIKYNRRSIYFACDSDSVAEVNEDFEEYNKKQLENMLENRMLVPNGYLRVHYLATEVNEKTLLLLPGDGFRFVINNISDE